MKPIRVILFITILCIFSISCSTTRKYTISSTQRIVHLNLADKEIDAAINTLNKPSANISLRYYWYDNKNIHSTQGGYSGYILNGDYLEYYYPGNNLAAKGKFRDGLKHGYWKTWYENGNLKDRAKWKHGQTRGKKYLYNNRGEIVRIEKYKRDLLNGKCIARDTNNTKITYYYKNGAIVQHRSPLLAFVNRFKKDKTHKSKTESKLVNAKAQPKAKNESKTAKNIHNNKTKRSLLTPIKQFLKKKPKNSAGNTKRK